MLNDNKSRGVDVLCSQQYAVLERQVAASCTKWIPHCCLHKWCIKRRVVGLFLSNDYHFRVANISCVFHDSLQSSCHKNTKKFSSAQWTFWVFVNEISLNYFNIILNMPCKVLAFKICKESLTLLELKAHLIKSYFQSLQV